MNDDPVFHRGPLVPVEWMVLCPVCDEALPVPEVEDDDAGVWHAAREHCVVECTCGAHIEPYGAVVIEHRDQPYRVKEVWS